jgi:hyaluronate lyase
MSSTRIATHESMQGVNMLGWYQGDGTLFIHTPDPTRFNEDFWPTINPYRLPGITVDTQPRKPGDTGGAQQGELSTSPWAGGVQLGDYAMASMHLAAQESTLTARKSWLFLGDAIVSLGSDINAQDDREIETIVENAKLNRAGDNRLIVNGSDYTAAPGWQMQIENVNWMHFGGGFPGADIGWYFPEPATLAGLRETRSGTWQDLFSRDAVQGEKTNHFLTLVLSHGKSPKAATYAYAAFPGIDEATIAQHAKQPPFKVVANTKAVHSLSAPQIGLRAATFWEAASADGITSSGPAAVIVTEQAGTLRVAIADPTHAQQRVELTVKSAASTVISADPRIEVVGTNPLKLKVDLERSYGRSIRIELK